MSPEREGKVPVAHIARGGKEVEEPQQWRLWVPCPGVPFRSGGICQGQVVVGRLVAPQSASPAGVLKGLVGRAEMNAEPASPKRKEGG